MILHRSQALPCNHVCSACAVYIGNFQTTFFIDDCNRPSCLTVGRSEGTHPKDSCTNTNLSRASAIIKKDAGIFAQGFAVACDIDI